MRQVVRPFYGSLFCVYIALGPDQLFRFVAVVRLAIPWGNDGYYPLRMIEKLPNQLAHCGFNDFSFGAKGLGLWGTFIILIVLAGITEGCFPNQLDLISVRDKRFRYLSRPRLPQPSRLFELLYACNISMRTSADCVQRKCFG